MSSLIPEFLQSITAYRERVEQRLEQCVAPAPGCPERLAEAIRYSVLAPGKRLRPLMCLFACEAVGEDWQRALTPACAVELVHVYSLIHDDLPAMDNDDLRRGLPTCHKQFDEATAILAGDSLQMLAMEVLCNELPPEQAWDCCRRLARAAGRTALVGGQADDLAAEGRFGAIPSGREERFEFLKAIHRRKTGALIQVSLELGGVAGGANLEELEVLGRFGQSIGLAFQIIDDCLDVESTSEQLGKRTGKDGALGKLTYPGLLGLEQSRELADTLVSEAKQSLAVFGDRAKNLLHLAEFIVERKF